MAEQQPPYIDLGHNFSFEPYRLDVFRMACTFLASEPIAAIASLEVDAGNYEASGCPLEDMSKRFFTDETSRILLQTAIVSRVLIDRNNQADPEEVKQPICGRLEEPFPGSEGALTFREASNKIIHATKVTYDIEPVDHLAAAAMHGISHARPVVFLYGRRGRTNWRAELEIIPFASQAITLFNSSPPHGD